MYSNINHSDNNMIISNKIKFIGKNVKIKLDDASSEELLAIEGHDAHKFNYIFWTLRTSLKYI